MKGDFTRDTFDPAKHFSRVLMQQGRVQLDADWNEQASILLHYLRTLAKDILGPHAGPAGKDMGFEIISNRTAFYQEKINSLTPDDPPDQTLLNAVKNGSEVLIGPGRYYVQGVLVENDQPVRYTLQRGYGSSSQPELDEQLWENALLFYLDVWERHVTYVEDDRIREVALGGPDTCTRAQVVWKVKVLPRPREASVFNCDAVGLLEPLGTGTLRARARLDKPPTELCIIPPESRYRGAENQLYRVEVHGGGSPEVVTFKWSRENGSVTFPLRSLLGTTATLESLGRDLHLSLQPGDWVEIVDDDVAMSEEAGLLAQVDAVDRDDLTVPAEDAGRGDPPRVHREPGRSPARAPATLGSGG